MTPQDITKLIVRTSMKDRAAFDLLYRQTSAKLFGVCLRVLNDRTDAEEALQEMRAAERIDDLPVRRGRVRDDEGVGELEHPLAVALDVRDGAGVGLDAGEGRALEPGLSRRFRGSDDRAERKEERS